MNMKKFVAFILIIGLVLGGYLLATDQVEITFHTGHANKVVTGAAAETVKQDERALDGLKRIDDRMWNSIQNGGREAFSIMRIMSDPSVTDREIENDIEYMRSFTGEKTKRLIYILVETDDFCIGQAVHYWVTGNERDNHSECREFLYILRKSDGKWEPASLTEEEQEVLNARFFSLFDEGFSEAIDAGRNVIRNGSMRWTKRDAVLEGVYDAQVAYLYQNKDNSVTAVVMLSNGTSTTKKVHTITLDIQDEKLGRVFKTKHKCDVIVMPGESRTYEVTIPKNKVKKGTWTDMTLSIDTDY